MIYDIMEAPFFALSGKDLYQYSVLVPPVPWG